MTNSVRWALVFVLNILAKLMGLSGQRLTSQIRIGLEFRGDHKIYYVAAPAVGTRVVSAEDMLSTAKILLQRADTIGMAEPEIHIESENHIRVQFAELTSYLQKRRAA